jgi:hypothetical protein
MLAGCQMNLGLEFNFIYFCASISFVLFSDCDDCIQPFNDPLLYLHGARGLLLFALDFAVFPARRPPGRNTHQEHRNSGALGLIAYSHNSMYIVRACPLKSGAPSCCCR